MQFRDPSIRLYRIQEVPAESIEDIAHIACSSEWYRQLSRRRDSSKRGLTCLP